MFGHHAGHGLCPPPGAAFSLLRVAAACLLTGVFAQGSACFPRAPSDALGSAWMRPAKAKLRWPRHRTPEQGLRPALLPPSVSQSAVLRT